MLNLLLHEFAVLRLAVSAFPETIGITSAQPPT
jgi:hypothetical protein